MKEPIAVEMVNYSICAQREKKMRAKNSYVKTLIKVKQISYQKEKIDLLNENTLSNTNH